MPLCALVCDDDSPVRRMVREMLVDRGVEVIEAEDGQKALSLFKNERIDLLVIDFLMPKIDGLQVIRAIRLSGKRGQMPVILMSAISHWQIKMQVHDHADLGVSYYINKPFRPKKLGKLLDRVLKQLQERS